MSDRMHHPLLHSSLVTVPVVHPAQMGDPQEKSLLHVVPQDPIHGHQTANNIQHFSELHCHN